MSHDQRSVRCQRRPLVQVTPRVASTGKKAPLRGGPFLSPFHPFRCEPCPHVIALESVSKRFGSKTIVHDVSFTVEKGEIVGFLGPNGAGKTTTMRMIAGFTTASSGRITVAGFDMATQNEQAARKIGYLPGASRRCMTRSTCPSTCASSPRSRAFRVRRSDPSWIGSANACRLEAVLDREIYKLSKGYRQRVGLAQALLGKPEVLLLDEPTAGPRPGADSGNPGSHPLLRRASRGAAEHPHPPGGHVDLPAGRHHQSGPSARHRFARAACSAPPSRPTG